jgi:hypothetical protein
MPELRFALRTGHVASPPHGASILYLMLRRLLGVVPGSRSGDAAKDVEIAASWHLVAPHGRTYSCGEAVVHLARLLPAGAPIAALAVRAELTRRAVRPMLRTH